MDHPAWNAAAARTHLVYCPAGAPEVADPTRAERINVRCDAMHAGLCNICRHQRIVKNTRGSTFSLCERSKAEPERFPRYPRIPVTRCAGHEPTPPAESPPAAS